MEIPVYIYYCDEDGYSIEYKAPQYLYNMINVMHIVPQIFSQIQLYHICYTETLAEYLEEEGCDGVHFEPYMVETVEYYSDSIRICVK
jgi:hypothetical protein